MQVCAEALFALNALIDVVLLACSARLCGSPIRKGRLALAGLLGGLYSVAALWPGLGFLQHGLIRFCVMVLMLVAAFDCGRQLLRQGMMFLACGCCFAGVVFAMTQLTGAGLLRLPGGTYYPVSALSLLALVTLCWAVCRLLFSGCAQHAPRQMVQLHLRLGSQSRTLRALVDTGNTLKDPMTNEPVLVAGWELAAALLPGLCCTQQEFRNAPELMRRLSRERPELRTRLIPYRSVGVSQGLLLAVRCEAQVQDRPYRPALLAFSPTPVSAAGEYEVLTGGAA